jgi:hypothetical protein
VTGPIAEFPELGRLVDLREAGWLFVPKVSGDDLVRLDAIRTWPDGTADALMIRFTTDAGAFRITPAGDRVWQHDGGLAEVVDAVLALPLPGALGAPSLVLGAAPRLWTP